MALNDTNLDDSLNSGNYWLNRFRGELSTLELSTDRIRNISHNPDYQYVTYSFEKIFSNELKLALNTDGNSSLSVFIALINTLLYRYTNKEDIVLGSQVPVKTHEGFKSKMNAVALRNQFSGEDTFAELHEKVCREIKDAITHPNFTLENLINELNLKEDKPKTPLFNVVVVVENEENQKIEVQKQYFTNPDLIFRFNDFEENLRLSIEYDSELFYKETIERIFGHLEGLITSIINHPTVSINKLDYLSEKEKNQLLMEFNNPSYNYPDTITIVDLFEEQVLIHPNNIALSFENDHITYSELNLRVNQLAHHLQKKGVIKDVLVPVCIEKSIEMVVAILGILKAGGAYVPIDPDYPADRIRYILDDTGASIVLSSEKSCLKLVDCKKVEVLLLDSDWGAIANEPADNIHVNIEPGDLAYVIYTSGSTGTPKGVLIEHRNVVRLFKTDKPIFDFNEKDVWTMFHSYCFDFSVWEMYGALFYGGRLVIIPKHISKDFSLYAELLINENVSILNQTPSAFYVLQDYLIENKKFKPMRFVVFGGEALNPGKLKQWNELYPESKLINMYGITETTVHVTYQQIERQQIEDGKSLIGKPIPTLTLNVLDDQLNLLPIGIAGELCIGGDGLARGYLNRPELTSERFVRNPYYNGPESRLYRSGDLGKRLPDGNIEYLGRIDNQIKIRGYRIELGEIENVIESYPSIESAIVIVNGNTNTGKYLVSFVVGKGEINIKDLTDFLLAKLPEYMIPAFFEQINEIPLTSNGKIDKKLLSESFSLQKKSQSTLLSGTPVLKDISEGMEFLNNKIKDIILNISGFELNASNLSLSFIGMGLNSLLLTQLSHTIKKEFGLIVTFRQLNEIYLSPELLIEYIYNNNNNNNNENKSVQTFNETLGDLESSLELSDNPKQIIPEITDFVNPPVSGAKLGRDRKAILPGSF